MNAIPQPNLANRRIVYVDEKVQKWLIIALVTLEVLLLSGALWVIYLQLSGALDANLYRAHIAARPRIYPPLQFALIGLVGLATINIVALLVADWVWARHLDSILQPLLELVGRVEALDFLEDTPAASPHKVVDLARAWRKTERQRLLNLRAAIAQLETPDGTSSPEAEARTRVALEAVRKLLP